MHEMVGQWRKLHLDPAPDPMTRVFDPDEADYVWDSDSDSECAFDPDEILAHVE